MRLDVYFFAFLIGLAGCASPVRLPENMKLIEDSEEVRRQLFQEAKRQLEIQPKWEISRSNGIQRKEMQERRRFFEQLDSKPSFELSRTTDAKIVKESRCRCLLNISYTSSFVKVRLKSGPLANREGWVCSEKVRRLWIWP